MDSNHADLAVVVLDSAPKKADNYYPQVFLKECKYIEKNNKSSDNTNDSDDE